MTTFLDLDPIEEHLGQSVSRMDNQGLFKYSELYHHGLWDHSLKDSYGMAHGRIKWLRNNYEDQAGDIIKWVWYRYNGLRDGQKFTFSWFTDKQMWWARRLQGEMAGHRVELLKRMAQPKDTISPFTTTGFMNTRVMSTMSTAQILAGGGTHSVKSDEQIPHR